MNREELHELMNQADSMPYSKTSSQLWAEAAMVAAEGEYTEEHVRCLMELMHSYRNGGEPTRLIAPFLQLLQLYAAHPEVFDDEQKHSLAWGYRYAIQSMWSVPEVPAARIRTMLDDAHEYYLQLGDSRRALFQLEYSYARRLNDKEGQERAYQQWMNAEHTELSNCVGCDPEYEVEYIIAQGRHADAIACGLGALGDEGRTCHAQPYSMLTELLEPYLELGQYDEAWNAHLRAIRHVLTQAHMYSMLPQHLEALSRLALAARPQAASSARDMLVRFIPRLADAESPEDLYRFVRAAAVVCAVQPAEEKLAVVLPGLELVWTQAPTLENPTAQQAHRWFFDVATELARRFDSREGVNGTAYQDSLSRALEGLHTPPQPQEVADVSGIFVVTENSEATPENQPENNSEADAGYPPLEELNASAAWGEEELRLAHEHVGRRRSSYSMRLAERGIAVPEEGKDWAELAEPFALMEARQYMEAAGATDEILRTDPAAMTDALGTRFIGLRLLADAAVAAGYPEEALEVLRDLINLAAAAQLPSQQLEAATLCAEILRKRRRIDEACNVLYNALLAARPLLDKALFADSISQARLLYIDVLLQDEDFGLAAEQELLVAATLEGREQVHTLVAAATHLMASRRIDEARQTLEEALELADASADTGLQGWVREQFSIFFGQLPWPGTDADCALVRQLQQQRRDLMLAHPEDFGGRPAALLEADSFETEAYVLHNMECFAEASATAEEAVERFLAAQAPESAVELLLNLSENRLAYLRDAPSLTDASVVQAWLDRAQGILDAHETLTPRLRFRREILGEHLAMLGE